MDALNTVFIFFLFLGPGLLIKAFSNFITLSYNQRENKQSIYEQLFMVVVHSIIVTGTTIAVINILSYFSDDIVYIFSFEDLLSYLTIIQYSITYLILSLIICSIWYWAYNSKIKIAIFNYRNKKLEKNYEVTIASPDGFSVWESLIYKKNDNKNKEEKYKPVISIHKDGQRIASGFLEGCNDYNTTNQEVELLRSREISWVLDQDEKKEKKDRWLSKIEREYFDFETGVLIKFYNTEKLIEHWAEIDLKL